MRVTSIQTGSFEIYLCNEIAQMVERRTVEPEVLDSNPVTGTFFWSMVQQVKSDRVNKIPTKQMYNHIMPLLHFLTILPVHSVDVLSFQPWWV